MPDNELAAEEIDSIFQVNELGQQEDGDGRPGDELFLFIRENVLVHNIPRLVDGIIIPRFSRCF